MNHRGPRGGPAGRGGRGEGGFDTRGNRNGGGSQEFGGWGDDRRNGPPQEVQFSVPSNKCGVIIGRGGETIKQINQQSGAYCGLDRKSQNSNSTEKTFIIRGEPDQIETAKRIICEKVQMPINFVPVAGNGVGGNPGGPMGANTNMPTAYPGMQPQGYNPQGWGVPNYQQQWGAPGQGGDASSQGGGSQVQMNPSTGQPDYSMQWAEYYRSLGMHREAEMIEQQVRNFFLIFFFKNF